MSQQMNQYHQSRQASAHSSYMPRQGMGQNMRRIPQQQQQQQQTAQYISSSPVSHQYQYQSAPQGTTMFLAGPGQQIPFMGTPQNQIVVRPSMNPGMPMYQQGQQYTITTSQPAPFAITPNNYYQHPGGMQQGQQQAYYQVPIVRPQMQAMPQAQQYQPSPQPMAAPPQTQMPPIQQQPQLPPPLPQKREKKVIPIIDPSSGQQLNMDSPQRMSPIEPVQSQKVVTVSITHPQINSSVPNSRPMPSSYADAEPFTPRSQISHMTNNVSAQFAAQVAASLGTGPGMVETDSPHENLHVPNESYAVVSAAAFNPANAASMPYSGDSEPVIHRTSHAIPIETPPDEPASPATTEDPPLETDEEEMAELDQADTAPTGYVELDLPAESPPAEEAQEVPEPQETRAHEVPEDVGSPVEELVPEEEPFEEERVNGLPADELSSEGVGSPLTDSTEVVTPTASPPQEEAETVGPAEVDEPELQPAEDKQKPPRQRPSEVVLAPPPPPVPSPSQELVEDLSDDDEEPDGDGLPTVRSQPSIEKLKYKYKEFQWSPINMEGKKQYDRDFLLQFQSIREKPVDLPDIPDIVRDNTSQPFNPTTMGKLDFTPAFLQTPNSRQQRPSLGPRGSRGGGSQSKGGRIIQIQRQPEVELHHASNPYKPKEKKERPSADPDSAKTEEILRNFRAILNKLTPQKFTKLVDQAVSIVDEGVDNEFKLTGIINIIFEKAVDEPAFSVAYANFCRVLCQKNIKVPGEEKEASFKGLLLNRCQKEFEKDKAEYLTQEQERYDAEIAAAEMEEKKRELTEARDDAILRARRRSLGNIRFIGELFRLGLLTAKIMHQCIIMLLKKTDEDSLECLCRLLMTVGGMMDKEVKDKDRMNAYMDKLEVIMNDKSTSPRIRFLILDVMEMRRNNWTKRRADATTPKTIEQIHKEVAEEKIQNQALVQRMSQERAKQPQPKQRSGPMVDEHGFQQVRANKIDHSKLRIPTLRGEVDENSIQLGPQSKFQGWGKGSTGGGGRNTAQEPERPLLPSNRFSALSDSSSMRPPANPPGRFDRQQPGKQQFKPSQQRSQERERSEALKAARKIAEPQPVPPPQEKKTFTDEDLTRKTMSVLEEYFHLKDLNEAKECVKELAGYYTQFVEKSVNAMLERSNHSRSMTGALFVELIKSNIVSVTEYLEGMKQVLEFADDMSIDIPKIWTYLAEIISPLYGEKVAAPDMLMELAKPLPSGKGAVLMAEVLNDAAHRLGHIAVAEVWQQSHLSWSDFGVSADSEVDFVISHNLGYLGRNVETAPRPDTSGRLDEKKLYTMMMNKAENDNIFDYIDGMMTLETAKKPANVKALMIAVCRAALIQANGKTTINKEAVKNRRVLLLKYMDRNFALEVQGLYGVQALVTELNHPSGLLREYFDLLYDEDIIAEDSFNEWNNTDDPTEQHGKGVAKAAVTQFFTWLHTTEAEDDA